MYVNKCIKCGREFETKNPKRVICPDCLYPDKKMMVNTTDAASTASGQSSQATEHTPSPSAEDKPQFYSSYSSCGEDNQRPYNRPQRSYNQGGYNNRSQGGYNNNYNIYILQI